MAGESVDAVVLDARGLEGDRWFAVWDEDGRMATGKNSRRFRRRDAIFEYAAEQTGDGVLVTRSRAAAGWSAIPPSTPR